MKKNIRPFNVIVEDNGQFKPYDVMLTLVNDYKERSMIRTKPTSRKECRKFVEDMALYHWWGRCEYEMILMDFSVKRHEKKIDIYEQVMMNIDVVTDLFIENIGLKCKQTNEEENASGEN